MPTSHPLYPHPSAPFRAPLRATALALAAVLFAALGLAPLPAMADPAPQQTDKQTPPREETPPPAPADDFDSPRREDMPAPPRDQGDGGPLPMQVQPGLTDHDGKPGGRPADPRPDARRELRELPTAEAIGRVGDAQLRAALLGQRTTLEQLARTAPGASSELLGRRYDQATAAVEQAIRRAADAGTLQCLAQRTSCAKRCGKPFGCGCAAALATCATGG